VRTIDRMNHGTRGALRRGAFARGAFAAWRFGAYALGAYSITRAGERMFRSSRASLLGIAIPNRLEHGLRGPVLARR